MPFASFHSRFPELAERETRVVKVFNRASLPADTYVFVESYCDEKRCDCRRVFINVFSEERKRVLSTISYGWEDRKFYQEWMHGDVDEEDLRELQGPALVRMAPQSSLARALLDLFVELVLNDAYIERLRRHYGMFREAVDKEHASRRPRRKAPEAGNVSRNAACPCGSGKKYKRCCGR